MPQSWRERWHRRAGRAYPGGQGLSFVADATDGSGRTAFIKTLKSDRQNDRRARERFYHEAIAYETLHDPGLPGMFEHNAREWRDRRVQLFMALEFIPGGDLASFVHSKGPPDLESALACTSELAAILQRCHAQGYIHRDVKPANVVLREGDISRPVLVDFGLSFNDSDQDDLTKVNEEVGNRFLRLPEHQFNFRAPASDVTQLAGVFFHLLTGIEPQALSDHAGQKPHQRAAARATLTVLFEPRQLRRLLAVFDWAFAQQISDRYQTPYDLMRDLERAVRIDDGAAEDDFDALMAEVDELTLTQEQSVASDLRASLTHLLRRIERIAMDFAEAKHLECTRTGWNVGNDGQHAEYRIAVTTRDERPTQDQFLRYTVEPRGAGELAVLVEDDEIWRGEGVDQKLTRAVTLTAMKDFLNRQR